MTRLDAAVLASLTVVVIVAKIPTLTTPYYWDEMSWAIAAHWVWEGGFLRALPGHSPPAMFFGHPVALHVTLAALWRLLGDSIPVAHGLALVFAVAGVCFTYLLGRTLYDRATGLLAALALFLSPLYFAQSGMFLGDVPVTALGVMSVYFAWHERYGAYLASAIPMVLVKETGMAFVVAIAVFVYLTARTDRVSAARRALPYALPFVPIGLFLGWQKLVTGDLFWIMEKPIPVVTISRARASRKVVRVMEWLFVLQLRWIFTTLVIVFLAVSARARRRTEWWLFAMIAATFAGAFFILYFLPRYILPVLPYLYLGGASALLALVPSRIGRVTAAVGVLALLGWSLAHQPFQGNGEFDLGYRDVVALHVEAAAFLEREHASRRIVTEFPHVGQLKHPFLGYVSRPLVAVSLEKHAPAADDVIVLSVPGTHHAHATMHAVAAERQWRLVRRFERGAAAVGVYRRG